MATDEEEYEEDLRTIRSEEARVERLMTAREIFAAGFTLGLSRAGLISDPHEAFDGWLLERAP